MPENKKPAEIVKPRVSKKKSRFKKKALQKLTLTLAPPLAERWLWAYDWGARRKNEDQLTMINHTELMHALTGEDRVIVSLWHNRLMFGPTAYKYTGGQGAAIMISRSFDGELIAATLDRFKDFRAVRGSSSKKGRDKGGREALLQMVEIGEEGYDLCITPDGPQGPVYEVKRGIIELAKITGYPIYPSGCGASMYFRVKSWDRTIVPVPFTHCIYKIGDPITVPPDADEAAIQAKREELESAMRELADYVDNFYSGEMFEKAANSAGQNADGTARVGFSVNIDRDKCTECGLCVAECVSGVIVERDGKPLPLNTGWCNLCSHCVAACPADAIEHTGLLGMPAERLKPEKTDPEAYSRTVRGRRSVRHFKNEPVPREDIEKILELAAYSPTASNSLDVGYTVVDDRELIANTSGLIYKQWEKLMDMVETPWGKLIFKAYVALTGQKSLARYAARFDMYRQWTREGRDMLTHNAPALVIVHAPEKSRFSDGNCHIAAANISNYAHALGYGTCYLGLLVVPMEKRKNLALKLGVPRGRKAFAVLALGKPAHKFKNAPVRPRPPIKWVG